MIECPNCHQMTREGKFCMNCGHTLNSESNNLQNQDNLQNNNENSRSYDNNIPTQNSNLQQYNNNYQQNQNNQQYHTYNNQQNMYNPANRNMPHDQKSKFLGIILNIIIPGLGYGYVNRWKEAIIFIIVYYFLWFLGFIIFIPWIINLIMWIYAIIKVNGMIDKYNNGLPY